MNNTRDSGTHAFDLAAIGLVFGALVHGGAWLDGPRGLAAVGAPPSIVESAAAGTWPAALGAAAIAALLAGLAISCFMTARGIGPSFQRHVLALIAAVFLARGLLVLPFVFTGQREWRTPVSHFIVTGQWFAGGSLIVLAIGVLISIGLFQSRSAR